MKKMFATVIAFLTLISCSTTSDEVSKVDDSHRLARFFQDTHIQFPTLKSKLIEEAQAELNATGNNSKLTKLDEMGQFRLVDSLYSSDFTEFSSEDGVDLIHQYKTLTASYRQNQYQQAHLRSGLSRRILLNTGLINSEDALSVSFFANELIASQLGEYKLIIRCLEKVNGKIPTNQARQMSATLHQQIEKSRVNEIELARGIKSMIAEREKQLAANPATKKGRLMLQSMKEIDLGARQEVLEECAERLSKL